MTRWSVGCIIIGFLALACGDDTADGTSPGTDSGILPDGAPADGSSFDASLPGDGGATAVPDHIFFHSDWSTARGTTDDALLDTGKDVPWDAYKGSTPRGSTEVVATASLGFAAPSGMANCLMIRSDNNASEGVRMTSLPIPAPGTTQWRRYYVAVVLPDEATFGDQGFHPLDYRHNAGGTYTLAPHVMIGDDGTRAGVWWHDVATIVDTGLAFGEERYVLGTSLGAAAHPFGERRGTTELSKNAWYGIEYQILRVSTTHFRVQAAWIYDVDGTTRYDADDFYLNTNDDIPMSAETLDWELDDELDFANQNLGVNGFPPGYPVADVMCWGGVAMSDREQVGPWAGY
jgi:hypothetical protein